MHQEITIVPKQEEHMKTYAFKVVVEPDGDRWFAYCPVLEKRGAATWGYTKDEALRSIQEATRLYIDSLLEHGDTIPADSPTEVMEEPAVAITV